MPSSSTLVLFGSAALVLLVIPGPSVLYIVTRSIDQGPRAGRVSVLGTHAGPLVHVTGAAFGLSALIVSSALAFSAVKYLGAAFLVWLGVRRWRAGDHGSLATDRPGRPMAHLFRQAFVVQVLNPKNGHLLLGVPPSVHRRRPRFGHRPGARPRGRPHRAGTGELQHVRHGHVDDRVRVAAQHARPSPPSATYRAVYVGLGVTTAVAGGHNTARS